MYYNYKDFDYKKYGEESIKEQSRLLEIELKLLDSERIDFELQPYKLDD